MRGSERERADVRAAGSGIVGPPVSNFSAYTPTADTVRENVITGCPAYVQRMRRTAGRGVEYLIEQTILVESRGRSRWSVVHALDARPKCSYAQTRSVRSRGGGFPRVCGTEAVAVRPTIASRPTTTEEARLTCASISSAARST